jgi:hypothetical protein
VLVRPESQDDPAGVWERVLRLAREDLSVDLTVVGGDDGVAADRHLDAPAQRALDEAEATFQGQLRALKDAPSTSAAFAWDGVGFADRAAEADLRALLLDLLPRTVGRAEGLRSLLRGGGCKVLCAPALDTLSLAAARAEGVATATLERAEDGPRLLQALLAAGRAEGMVG